MSLKVLRESDGMWLNQCIEPGCGSTEFHVLLNLQHPVIECAKCGRRQLLIDSHSRLPIGHSISASGLSDERSGLLPVRCHVCQSTGWLGDGYIRPCEECFGTGRLQLDSNASREARRARKRQEKEFKGLDPDR